jgi:hypothetical protein
VKPVGGGALAAAVAMVVYGLWQVFRWADASTSRPTPAQEGLD